MRRKNDYFAHCNISYYTKLNTKDRPRTCIKQMAAELCCVFSSTLSGNKGAVDFIRNLSCYYKLLKISVTEGSFKKQHN
jgi:hypothetical protein